MAFDTAAASTCRCNQRDGPLLLFGLHRCWSLAFPFPVINAGNPPPPTDVSSPMLRRGLINSEEDGTIPYEMAFLSSHLPICRHLKETQRGCPASPFYTDWDSSLGLLLRNLGTRRATLARWENRIQDGGSDRRRRSFIDSGVAPFSSRIRKEKPDIAQMR